jgi:hypothetical protein
MTTVDMPDTDEHDAAHEFIVALMAATDDEIMEVCDGLDIPYDFEEGKFVRKLAIMLLLRAAIDNDVDMDKLDALIDE